jgi:hypothetical protein
VVVVGTAFQPDRAVIFVSENGVDWTEQGTNATGQIKRLLDVTSDGSRYVAVGGQTLLTAPFGGHLANGAALVSTNGRDWSVTRINEGQTIWAVTFNQGVFVAVGGGGYILRSTDGVNWTTPASGVTDDLLSVTCGNGVFVAVGGRWGVYTTNVILTSPDGITWTKRSAAGRNTLTAVGWHRGHFLAARWYGPYLTSTNGIDWVGNDLGSGSPPGYRVTDTSPRVVLGVKGWFVISGDYGTWYSADLKNWGAMQIATTGMHWSGDKCFAAVNSGFSYHTNLWTFTPLPGPPFEVSVSASGHASEGGQPARFEVRRAGPTTIDLRVPLTHSGSASNGVDYAAIPSVVIVPAGQAAVEIPLQPLPDQLVEGTETVTLGILPDVTYAIVPACAEATVSLLDLGNAPRFRTTGITRWPDGSVTFTVERPPAGNWLIEGSSDLVAWNAIRTINAGSGPVEVRDDQATTARRFYRARGLD